MQMHQLDARARRMLEEIRDNQARRRVPVENIEAAPRGGAFAPFANGGYWGREGAWVDFRFSVTLPADFVGPARLCIRTGRESGWDALNPQFVVWVNGKIEQAFDVNHTTLPLPMEPRGQRFDILLGGYAKVEDPHDAPYLELWLEDVNEPVRNLLYDIEVPYQSVLMLPEGERDREVVLETLSRAMDLLDLREKHSPAFDASVEAARAYLAEHLYQARESLPPVALAQCVGHTHIDVAWLWDLEQTRHKTVRSFATVLKLMERYPEYLFMSSQAALYNMVKHDQPELYGRILEAVRAGRWEPEGGMWVEADCNLAGGESLVRQFLQGQAFFTREFGRPSRVLWLPDVFGYSAALPQIMKLSGIDYFMTTKLSWSEFNLSPYDTFLWQGIDGSEVLTHFSPSRDFGQEGHTDLAYFTTYNAMLNPSQLKGGWQRFQQKGLDDQFLVTYGFGDGGGGPTEWMLENGRRLKTPMPGVPAVRQTHARPFFEALQQRVSGDPRLPKWSGELYLEYHRGTYTAMARNKRNNRKAEIALREVELWRSQAWARCGLPYPQAELTEIWQDILTLQFHDILPGSSIKKVYDDSDEMYQKAFAALAKLREEGIQSLTGGVAGDLKVFNSLSHVRDDLVWFDAPAEVTALRDHAGNRYPIQQVEGRAVAFVRGLAPMGPTAFWYDREPIATPAVQADERGFETPLLKGRFDAAMRIESLLHKPTGRELAKPGEVLNRLVCYENKPHNYDAWDINIYYDRRHWEVTDLAAVEVVAAGPVLCKLRATYRYQRSTIRQEIVIYRDLERVDFETQVNWREQQYLLKAHFPVDLFYQEATFDIQYGNLRRATHKNTRWDIARFEVCGHKWADVSEDGFGVALLNDCKYGYSVDEHSLALTLLKSSTHPNPVADQEQHTFTYALMPHSGGWREGGVVEAAYHLNIPITASTQPGQGAGYGTFGVAAPNVVIEAVKQAESGDGVIVRLYECFGRRSDGVLLELGRAPEGVQVVNLLEQPIEDARVEGSGVRFDLKPYEIKSFWVR